jgi:hypothetical protein
VGCSVVNDWEVPAVTYAFVYDDVISSAATVSLGYYVVNVNEAVTNGKTAVAINAPIDPHTCKCKLSVIEIDASGYLLICQ